MPKRRTPTDEDKTTVQILDGEGKPITPKMTTEEFNNMAKRAEAVIGHNSGEISTERLRSFVKRIEKLNDDAAAVSEDRKEVYAEAKGTGYNTKIIRKIVRMRQQEVEKRKEEEELTDLYMHALGMAE